MTRRAAAALAAMLLMGGGGAAARELAEIRSSGELRICVAGTSAEFYRGNGIAFARHLGVAPALLTLPSWDHQFHDNDGKTRREATYTATLLASGACDLYPNDLHILPWRQSKMHLVPYFTTRSVALGRLAAAAQYRVPGDLGQKVGAVQQGTSYEDILLGWNRGPLRSRPVAIHHLPTADGIREVAEGRVDFTVIGAEAALRAARGDPERLTILFPVDAPITVGWGVSPDAPRLREALEEFFAANARVGSDLDRGWLRYYGISLLEYRLFMRSLDDRFDLREHLYWISPLGAALLGLLVAWLARRRQVRDEARRREQAELEMARARADLEQQAARLDALNHLALSLQQAEGERAVGARLFATVERSLPLVMGLLCRHDPAAGRLIPVFHHAGAGHVPAATLSHLDAGGGLLRRAIDSSQRVVIADPEIRVAGGTATLRPAALILLPIADAGVVIAVIALVVLSPPSEEHFRLLDGIAPILAIALRNRAGNPPQHGHDGRLRAI